MPNYVGNLSFNVHWANFTVIACCKYISLLRRLEADFVVFRWGLLRLRLQRPLLVPLLLVRGCRCSLVERRAKRWEDLSLP